MVTEVLVWTCTIVFVVTAAITILSIINAVKIKAEFQNKLFYALILEVIMSGVIVFKKIITEQNQLNIIRTVSPLPNVSVNLEKGQSLFINGFCQKQADVSFSGNVIISGKSYKLDNFVISDKNVFTASASISESIPPAPAKIILNLISNGRIIFTDSASTEISVK